MEKLSAVHRTPTEIWHEIFTHVLKTWLLPSSHGDNVFDDISLFSRGCKIRAEHRRVESDRRDLRTVCRHWKAIADRFAINLAVTNFEYICPILEKRLILSQRVDMPTVCICFQCPSRIQGHIKVARTQLPGNDATTPKPLFSSPFSLKRVRVISSGPFDSFGRLNYISSAPNLRALGVHVGSLKGVTTLDHLTHLSIHGISGREVLTTINLPRLRCLYLHLALDQANEPTPRKHFDYNIFPKITFLSISGIVLPGIQHDGLRRFIGNHASTLENLILIYSIASTHNILSRDQPESQTINVRDPQHYRRLEVLGLNIYGPREMGGINEPGPVDNLCPPLSLLLRDIGSLPGRPDVQTTAKHCLGLVTHPTANFEKIVMIHSWEQVLLEWETYVAIGMRSDPLFWREINPLDTPREFFRVVYKADVVFTDKRGVELREGDGIKLLEKLGLTD
ncbi:hypothetical protein FRC19_001681 [Serendipita sp. 401]|nr:hypothetical protein FRC19_001681 [Serendipita sp. 401]